MNKQQAGSTLYQYLLIIIILVAIAVRGGRDFLFHKSEVEVNVTLKDIKEIYPEAETFKVDGNGVYEAYNSKDQKLGSALLSTEYSRQFGYGGIVPLLIGVDDSLSITKVTLLPNNETLDYIRAVYEDRFIGSWKGVSLSEAIDLKVDAVSGATHTSKAVIKGVRQTAASVMSADAAALNDSGYWAVIKDVLFLALVLLSLVMVYKKGSARYRTLYMFLVLLVMGLILNNALSAQLLSGWLKDGFMWRSNWQSAVIFLLAIIISFLGKRKFYCNYLCPMGALQELTNRFSPFKKKSLPTRFMGISAREVYLVLIAGALLLGFTPELSYAEPFMFFSFRVAGIGLILFGIVVILLSVFFTKPWCAVCPTGCLLDTVSYKKIKSTKSQ